MRQPSKSKMMEETVPDSAGKASDKLDNNDSPIHSNQGSTIARYDDVIIDRSPSSPVLQAQGEEPNEEPQHKSSAHDTFRSDALDQGQFYPVSARSLMSLGQENQYDDLPLAFSLPSQDDEAAKVYSCPLCNFRTAFKNSLVNHQAVHSDARPWICEICDYAAKRKQDLKKHLQTMHGMIVDSLSLRMGNNPQNSVSSSGLSSPVDIKPVLVSNALCGDGGNSSVVGSNGVTSAMNCAGDLTQQQTITGLRQTRTSSTMLSPYPRSAPAVAGKIRDDPFPFTSALADDKMSNRFAPNSSTDTSVTCFKPEFRKESSSSHSLSSGSSFSQKPHRLKEEELLHSCSENTKVKSYRQTEGSDVRNLPSISKLLPKWNRRNSSVTETCASANTIVLDSPQHSDSFSSEGVTRSETLSSCLITSPHSGATDAARRQKRSVNSGDWTPVKVKVPRFQSPTSDVDCCPQVSSQSERPIISSTVAHSHALQTNKSFHCVHCDILFFESAMYLMHAGLHDSDNPWKCSVCGRTFFERYSFTSHFINQH